MPEDAASLSCEEFQNQLAELHASGEDVASHPHAKACGRCCGFIRDIYQIAENSHHFRFGLDESGSDDWSEST